MNFESRFKTCILQAIEKKRLDVFNHEMGLIKKIDDVNFVYNVPTQSGRRGVRFENKDLNEILANTELLGATYVKTKYLHNSPASIEAYNDEPTSYLICTPSDTQKELVKSKLMFMIESVASDNSITNKPNVSIKMR